MIAKLNAWSRGGSPAPLVLTCRDELYFSLSGYRGEAGLAGTRVLDAATVRVADLGGPQVIRYISQRVVDLDRWEPVLADLTGDSSGALRDYLNTPWRLMLATTVYERDDRRSPSELTDRPAGLDERLLPSYLRTVIAPATASRPPRYDPDKAEHWLVQLAAYLDQNTRSERIGGRFPSGVDLILHDLWPFAGQRAPRNVDTVLSVLLSAPGLAWAGVFAFSHAVGWRIAYVVVLAGYFAALVNRSQAYWTTPGPLTRASS